MVGPAPAWAGMAERIRALLGCSTVGRSARGGCREAWRLVITAGPSCREHQAPAIARIVARCQCPLPGGASDPTQAFAAAGANGRRGQGAPGAPSQKRDDLGAAVHAQGDDASHAGAGHPAPRPRPCRRRASAPAGPVRPPVPPQGGEPPRPERHPGHGAGPGRLRPRRVRDDQPPTTSRSTTRPRAAAPTPSRMRLATPRTTRSGPGYRPAPTAGRRSASASRPARSW